MAMAPFAGKEGREENVRDEAVGTLSTVRGVLWSHRMKRLCPGGGAGNRPRRWIRT